MAKHVKGFTLIELIVVIGIIAILAAIVIVAVNPSRSFALSRNTKRRNDVLAIANAVNHYASDNNGILPSVITTTPTDICFGSGTVTCDPALIDLGESVLVSTYVAAIPHDPGTSDVAEGTDADTLYQISHTADNRVVVSAPNAELGATISVTR